MPDYVYFLRYWAICVLQLFNSYAITSKIVKLTLSFKSSCFSTWPKSQNKTLNILRTKRSFKVNWKAFFIIFKGLLVTKNRLKTDSAPLRNLTLHSQGMWYQCKVYILLTKEADTQLTLTCSMSAIGKIEKGVKYVQS